MVRFAAAVAMSYNADFETVSSDGGDVSTAVMYRETGTADAVPGAGGAQYDRYQKLWSAADSDDDTIAFIRKRIRELR